MPRIDVVIVHLDDPRVEAAIRSALSQDPAPCHVIVADGGSRSPLLDRMAQRLHHDPRVRLLALPGNVAETRANVLPYLDAPIGAFLDSDQRAPSGWLAALTAPIAREGIDQTCGPTRPASAATNGIDRYVQRAERRLYRAAARDPRLFPAGNSAWNVASLRAVGGFDPRMGHSAEDYDLNLRAGRIGCRARFIAGAWVYHDQSHLRTARAVLRRKYLHFQGAALAYFKNDMMGERGRAAARRFRMSHWLDAADVCLKPLAFLHARKRYRAMTNAPSACAPLLSADTVK